MTKDKGSNIIKDFFKYIVEASPHERSSTLPVGQYRSQMDRTDYVAPDTLKLSSDYYYQRDARRTVHAVQVFRSEDLKHPQILCHTTDPSYRAPLPGKRKRLVLSPDQPPNVLDDYFPVYNMK